jgi:translation elongation factor EF-Ts
MEIALVILSVMSLSFLIAYLSVSHKLNVINKGFAQLFVAYNTLRDIVDGKPTKTEEDIHKENFIKFLSDSRDWAFDYIEDVQKGLSKFIKEVEPQLEYYNQYGVVIEGMVPPHDFALKKISKEFEELKKLLPEETDDRR